MDQACYQNDVKKMSHNESVRQDKIQETILSIVNKRGPEKTCCPSEVARKLDPRLWRGLMEDVRAQSVKLAEMGIIEICQKGQPLTSMDFKGPIRLRIKVQRVQEDHESTATPKVKEQDDLTEATIRVQRLKKDQFEKAKHSFKVQSTQKVQETKPVTVVSSRKRKLDIPKFEEG